MRLFSRPISRPAPATRHAAARIVAIAALTGVLGACSNGTSDDAASGYNDRDAPTTTTAADTTWERITPGGDCQCSDGSEFNFWLHEANPQKVIFYLQDGGACFSAETCDPDSGLYQPTVQEGPSDAGGVFDFADERNPLADYSAVFVPYCTGDVHLGDVTTEYAPGLTVHHKGLINGTAALDHLAATFPDATDILVIGESAGSVSAPLYAGLVSDRFPDARITALADGSGSYPDMPAFNRLIREAWGTVDAVPAWPENAGTAADLWSAPGLYIQSGRHDPDIVFARHDYAYDARQTPWFSVLGVPTDDLLARMDANEAQIESTGVDVASYTAPGHEHTTLTHSTFYTEEVNGQPLVDWVAALFAGQPVSDVHCTECEVD